ncbi:DUF2007 domain-containing protein [Daejeonella sp. H1SJ63]|jgi:hypothetical protein|uniref:DUF2007 domain-containing protein n=1 Tax=Daejeonella sp. H1SJ63 TaxID=3034145 RepID=UPI0023ED553A|nr:DUF2007 domain-containing protein [Daejeonella sp. H1SJ63]
MEAGWVKIFSSADFFKSELVRQVLIDHEIEAILINKQGFPYRIGEAEVYIHQENSEKAMRIITENEL